MVVTIILILSDTDIDPNALAIEMLASAHHYISNLYDSTLR